MDFDRLPDTVFLQIFRNLPFKTRLQLSAVSKGFQRMSTISLSETRCLRMSDPVFDRLTPAALFEILKLCSNNLQVIKFLGKPDYKISTLVVAFSYFSCRNLNELEISTNFVTGNTVFPNIIRNNTNLKRLIYENMEHVTIFPMDVISNLESISLSFCDDNLIDSLIFRCPNLNHFEVTVYCNASNPNLDRFFSTCIRIEILSINYLFAPITESVSIWQLENLRVLSIRCEIPLEDTVLTQIASSFPNLETLAIRNLDISSHGLSTLTSLVNLKILVLSKNENGSNLDEGARNVALYCTKLRLVQFFFGVGPAVMRTMAACCPYLDKLGVSRVTNVQSTVEAVQMVTDMNNREGKQIKIRISSPDHFELWDTEEVQQVIGQTIQFERGWFNWSDD